MNEPTLYLMVGYPGSGKTTVSHIVHDLTGAIHLWADHERQQMFKTPQHTRKESVALYNELNQRTDELLRAGKSVIFDTNFNFYKDREHLRRIAARNGARSVVIWVTTDKALARERATKHSEGQGTRIWGNMPGKDFDRLAGNLEPPRDNEHVIHIDGTHLTRDIVQQKLQQHFSSSHS